MNFEADNFYHIYNRGNNKQVIFFSDNNYTFFLQKIKRYIIPHCHVVSYCLMPNHFHLLIYADHWTVQRPVANVFLSKNVLSEGMRMLLSSYTKAINRQEGRKGNLFQQNTHAKATNPDEFTRGRLNDNSLYEMDCFNYIHNNPVKAGLVENPSDWNYSSYNEYNGRSNTNICNRNFGIKLFRH